MLDKESVGFEHPAKGEHHCSECQYYIAPEENCMIVKGKIEPKDWCERWKKARFKKTPSFP